MHTVKISPFTRTGLSAVRFVCLTFTSQIKNKHQELEGRCSSDRAASLFGDSSVNETTVRRALLFWGFFIIIIICLLELFISQEGRTPAAGMWVPVALPLCPNPSSPHAHSPCGNRKELTQSVSLVGNLLMHCDIIALLFQLSDLGECF